MKLSLSLLFCPAGLGFIGLAGAVRLQLEGRHIPSLDPERRARAGPTLLENTGNTAYFTNISLGSPPTLVTVNIDTGSSDLWVNIDIPGSTSTTTIGTVPYASKKAQGPISFADLEFGGFVIPNQGYIHATNSDTPDFAGLIGLGPSGGSQIRSLTGDAAGDPPLDQIFRQDPSTPNFLSLLLGRANDPGSPNPGELSIGETLPGFDDILSQPKLPVTIVSLDNTGNQHFQVLLDDDGIVGPNGQVIPISTDVDSTVDKQQATVVFDSGFSFPQVPKPVADAIYSGVPGATFDQDDGLWILPCDQELSLTFKFAGVSFPIHPLDINQELSIENGSSICIGAFQPISFDVSSLEDSAPTFDIILGMSFLRNAYLLINYGDFVDGATDVVADPYIQLFPLNNNTAALHTDFLQARGNSSSTSGTNSGPNDSSGNKPSTPTGNGTNNPLGNDAKKNSSTKTGDRISWIIVSLGVGAALLSLVMSSS